MQTSLLLLLLCCCCFSAAAAKGQGRIKTISAHPKAAAKAAASAHPTAAARHTAACPAADPAGGSHHPGMGAGRTCSYSSREQVSLEIFWGGCKKKVIWVLLFESEYDLKSLYMYLECCFN
jgi:hypothetical protein